MMRRAIDWALRSRETGRITIAQFPNAALWVFLGATLLAAVAQPAGAAGQALSIVGTAALVGWALDEVVRGVNPWRRLLGGGMLAWEAAQLLSR